MKRFKNDLGWYFYKSRSGLGIRRKDPSRKSLRNRIIKALLFWIIAAIGTYFITISKEGCPPEIALSIITWNYKPPAQYLFFSYKWRSY
jgi:hypothetical protein